VQYILYTLLAKDCFQNKTLGIKPASIGRRLFWRTAGKWALFK